MIAKDGTVKLMDFGIARQLVQTAIGTSNIVGTAAYMSPEQIKGETADARTDIYSLGLVMYELFSGRPAFQGNSPAEIVLKQVQEMPVPFNQIEPNLPPFISDIILKCIDKKPSKRFQSVARLQGALTHKRETPTETQSLVSLPLRFAQWQRTDWLLLALAAIGLLAGVFFSQQTSLAPRIRMKSDPAVLPHYAQGYAERLGAPLGTANPSVRAVSHQDWYNFVAANAGAKAALNLAGKPVPFLTWRIEWDNGTTIELGNGNSLIGFARNFASDRIESVSDEEAERLASAAVKDFFQIDTTKLQVQPSGLVMWRGQPAKSYTWFDPADYHGLTRHYIVRLVGKDIASLDSEFTLPAGSEGENLLLRQMAGYFVLAMLLPCVGIIQRRYVNLRSRWRIVVMVFAALMTGRLFWLAFDQLNVPVPLTIASFMNSVLAWSVLLFYILVAL
jgi:hypothetical protein